MHATRQGSAPPATPATPPMPGPRPGASEPGARSGPAEPSVPDTRQEAARATGVPAKPVGAPDARGGAQGGGVAPDPSLSWTAPVTAGGRPSGPSGSRPVVSFGEPGGYDERARPRALGARLRSRGAGIAACLVLGLGLVGGAVTGTWLVGGDGDGGEQNTFVVARGLWHSVPVDDLFPTTVDGQGAGPGGADRTWTRIAVAPDSGCTGAFDPLLSKALAPVGCQRLVRATYTDATQSFVTTVGLVFTKADRAAMSSLAKRFQDEHLGTRADLMPRPFAAKNTTAARFSTKQRASWTVSVLTDAPVVVYSVSGWADGRTVDNPQPAEQAEQSGATTPPAQAGLGNEAQGLADRIERALRKDVSTPPSKRPS